ncbi:MAG: CPBP family intramembrane metalloprotease [Bacteroidetes bacterium]|nr:CPBP family intramembrane metalloprotease [Bacteroidota bacterium]MBK8658831.1 CPBP family intramembrane metalloprotease [Bacteroidota bacterium]
MIGPDKKRLQYLSWLTLFGMSAIGALLIEYFQGRSIKSVLLGYEPHYHHVGHKIYYLQVAAGLFYGSFAAALAIILIQIKRFRNVRGFFENTIGDINPSFVNILFFSFCASVGEEVMFRAGLQPIVGIWPAAIVFVLLHGYINPSNFNLSVYGLFLIIVSAGFGYLFRFFGLFAAISAHFIYDVTMFCALKYAYKRGKMQEQPPIISGAK